jgi:hypothetical protein
MARLPTLHVPVGPVVAYDLERRGARVYVAACYTGRRYVDPADGQLDLTRAVQEQPEQYTEAARLFEVAVAASRRLAATLDRPTAPATRTWVAAATLYMCARHLKGAIARWSPSAEQWTDSILCLTESQWWWSGTALCHWPAIEGWSDAETLARAEHLMRVALDDYRWIDAIHSQRVEQLCRMSALPEWAREALREHALATRLASEVSA